MKKIKSLFVVVAALLFASVSFAQQSEPIPPKLAKSWVFQALSFLEANQSLLETNRNWTFVPYLSRAKGLKDAQGDDAEFGGGLAILYPLNDYVRAGFRGQYFAGEFFMPSVNIQLQSAYKIGGQDSRFSWSPVAYSAIASPIGGSSENGEVGFIYGAGLSVKYRWSDTVVIGIGYTVESWSNLDVDRVDQFGIHVSKLF